MGFTDTVTWSGHQLTLNELREFVERATGYGGDEIVRVTVEPRFNSPTDPGGTIRLSTSKG